MLAATKWFIRGLTTYTKSSFEKKSTRFNSDDLQAIDYINTSFVVTGANSGIGYATALDLARKGGIVHMICRNKERGEEALARIVEQSGSNRIHLHIYDLALQSEVVRMARHFVDRGIRIDVLILNAGVMMPMRSTTVEGHEVTFATNLLSPYLATSLLLDHLRDTHTNNTANKARVIFVSSGGALTQRMTSDYEFVNMAGRRWNAVNTYAQTKRALIYLADLFAERYSDYNTNFYSMHPGWVATPQLATAMPTFAVLTKRIQRTPEQGADTIIWLAVSPTVESESGGFYEDRELTAKHLTKDTESTRDEINQLWSYLGKCFQEAEQQPKDNDGEADQDDPKVSHQQDEEPAELVEGETHPNR
ncbi:hypothetical protein SAMD00019534_040610 [Acytostelium subglobosum LB1]|uniref:hypothetical protein n=1 Tax=Acytostelium subglobosum LB1 TaxID=1410327 RepID=UPI000644B425|nr:hypothetical protein SAMD00019534_040610 [Acytostelium subglobosum LB1]GAM20886.1 hypothetical protein SAMD00019534_040610 [Acytostelium subglobosum LB1]|eukprot:XP_012756020.1 hypothetical protein SAMD00019534_040610 [Acytostelium subglobosum LB1]